MEQTRIRKGEKLKCISLCQGLRVGWTYTAMENEQGGKVRVQGKNKIFHTHTTYFERENQSSPVKEETPIVMEETVLIETGFKAGDKVVCVAPPFLELTKGQEYTVLENQKGVSIVIASDFGIKGLYKASSFKSVNELIRQGDILQCVVKRNLLTIGDTYEAQTNEADNKVVVKNDRGIESTFPPSIFHKTDGTVKIIDTSVIRFKEGDIITCVSKQYKRGIKVGGKYVVARNQWDGNVRITNEEGIYADYPATCFQPCVGQSMSEVLDIAKDLETGDKVIMNTSVSTPAFVGIDSMEEQEQHPLASNESRTADTLVIYKNEHPLHQDINHDPFPGAPQIGEGSQVEAMDLDKFDYDEALKRPQDIVTRSGLKVLIGGLNPHALEYNRLVGWADGVGYSWSKEGRYHEDGENTMLDLFMRPDICTFYRNEYHYATKPSIDQFTLFDTLEDTEVFYNEFQPIAVSKLTYRGKKLISNEIVKHY
jgi:hypothetical protein